VTVKTTRTSLTVLVMVATASSDSDLPALAGAGAVCAGGVATGAPLAGVAAGACVPALAGTAGVVAWAGCANAVDVRRLVREPGRTTNTAKSRAIRNFIRISFIIAASPQLERPMTGEALTGQVRAVGLLAEHFQGWRANSPVP